MAPASRTVYTGAGKENLSADTDYSTYCKIKTRAGKKAKQGRTIAVDKRKIKLGSKVQINGKTKGTLAIGRNDAKDDVIAKAKESIADKLTGNIVKEIYVPGRIVNIVMK